MTRPKQVLRLGYKTHRYEIKQEDINKEIFQLLANRRYINQAAVKKILGGLRQNKHFDSSFVVNLRDNKYRLIDGNHRYEAIKRYLEENPANRIEVLLHIYENLNEEEERSLYTTYNLGRKQSTNDFVQQYKEEISIWKTISNPRKFPVKITVYGGTEALSFFKLVSAYLGSLQPKFTGGYIGAPLDFIEDAKNLSLTDINLMAQFLREYLLAFGPVRNNIWLKTTPLTAIMKIWMDNRDVNTTQMEHLFKRKLANNAAAIDLARNSGMSACRYAYDKYLLYLNENRTKDLFTTKDFSNNI